MNTSEQWGLHQDEWSLGELTDRVAAELTAVDGARGGVHSVNGRIREVPDARTIRWYQTLGIVDRPVLHGRVARYHYRHLLQLLAIKRMQAQGAALSTIQAELAGMSDQALEHLVRGTSRSALAPAEAAGTRAEPAVSSTEEPAGRFWASAPVRPRPAMAARPARPDAAEPGRTSADTGVVSGVRLADGLTLLINDPARALDHDDLRAIRAAAQELVEQVRRLGLNGATTGNPASNPGYSTAPQPSTRPKEPGR